MENIKNRLTDEEREFIVTYGGRIKDEDLLHNFLIRFKHSIKLDTLRRVRQRAGIKKDNRGRPL